MSGLRAFFETTNNTELFNNKLKELEAQGHTLIESGFFPKDSTVLKNYPPTPINTKNKHLHLLLSIIPLIFSTSERRSIVSYGGKHTVEKFFQPSYVSNGEFILVMLCLGYRMKSFKDSPNTQFYGYWSKNVDNELKHKFIVEQNGYQNQSH